jgi:hypothetical protein
MATTAACWSPYSLYKKSQNSNCSTNPTIRSRKVLVGIFIEYSNIQPGASYTIELTCTPKTLGLLKYVLMFNFSQHACTIARYVSINVKDKELAAQLKPTAPYKGNQTVKTAASDFIPGQPLQKYNQFLFLLQTITKFIASNCLHSVSPATFITISSKCG